VSCRVWTNFMVKYKLCPTLMFSVDDSFLPLLCLHQALAEGTVRCSLPKEAGWLLRLALQEEFCLLSNQLWQQAINIE